jgi:hypothetical protein
VTGQWQTAIRHLCKATVATVPALMEMVGSAKAPGLASQLPQLWLALAAMALPTGDPSVALTPESTTSMGAVPDSAGTHDSDAHAGHSHAGHSHASHSHSLAHLKRHLGDSEAGADGSSGFGQPSPSIVIDGSSLWKLCENHQDGKTTAKWSCQACASLPIAAMLRGPTAMTPSSSTEALLPALLLCDECDGFMHLAPMQKVHNRELLRLGVTKVRARLCRRSCPG